MSPTRKGCVVCFVALHEKGGTHMRDLKCIPDSPAVSNHMKVDVMLGGLNQVFNLA